MSLLDCWECEGEGDYHVKGEDGHLRDETCSECDGAGMFEVYDHPLTREDSERLAARMAESEASAAQWETFVCTHCRYYCDAWIGREPDACHSCTDGILVPLRELQAAARPVLPWRRRGNDVVAVEPSDPRHGDRVLVPNQPICEDGRLVAVSLVGTVIPTPEGSGHLGRVWVQWDKGGASEVYACQCRVFDPPKEPTDG